MNLEPNLTWYVLRSFTALAVVLGLILVVAALARRFLPGLAQGAPSSLLTRKRQRSVEVLEVTALDRQHRVALIEVEGRRLLVGFGGGQVSSVADLTDETTLPSNQGVGEVEEGAGSRLEAVP